MKQFVLLVVGLVFVSMQSGAADIYKWKDADGRVRYSDLPPPGKVPYESLSGKKADAAKAAAASEAAAPDAKSSGAAPTAGDKLLDAKKRKAEAENLQKKEDAKAEAQKMREQNCANAKANLQNFKAGGRMYKMGENGERQYMDDNDLAAGLERSNKEVEQWCN